MVTRLDLEVMLIAQDKVGMFILLHFFCRYSINTPGQVYIGEMDFLQALTHLALYSAEIGVYQ
jgi:hypothetical protein